MHPPNTMIATMTYINSLCKAIDLHCCLHDMDYKPQPRIGCNDILCEQGYRRVDGTTREEACLY